MKSARISRRHFTWAFTDANIVLIVVVNRGGFAWIFSSPIFISAFCP